MRYVVIEVTSWCSSFVAGHSYVHQRLTAVSLNVKQPSFKADFKQFIFSQPFKLFYLEAEHNGLFKPGQKPLKIIWCMEMCVTEIDQGEKQKDRMDHHH